MRVRNCLTVVRNMVPLSSLHQQFHSQLTKQSMYIAWILNIRMIRTDMDSFCAQTPADVFENFCSTFKGIRFIVLYPPKRSHKLPPLAGPVHTETISIPRGIFQSNSEHIAHNALSTALFMLGTHFAAM